MADIIGNIFANTLTGTSSADNIWGRGGNDTLTGGGGADHLYGEGGNDSLSGGIGADTLEGGEGADTLNGGAGDDIIYAGNDADPSANDVADGGSGNDAFAFDRANFATQADGGLTINNFQDGLDYFLATGTGNTLYYDQEWDAFQGQLTVVITDMTNTLYVTVLGVSGELSAGHFSGLTAL